MTTPHLRYQRLDALSILQRTHIALTALRFFLPHHYERNCKKIGKEPVPNVTLPFSGMDLLKYLAVPGELSEELLPDPGRHMQRIDDLLNAA